MKKLQLAGIIATYFLLVSCGVMQQVTQEEISGSPEEIKQALMEGKLIKPGDWIRATTNDERIYELSFVGITEDELQGGDAIVPLSQIKKLEIYPLIRREGVPVGVLHLIDENAFTTRLSGHISKQHENLFMRMTLINGEDAPIKPLSIENGIIVGEGARYSDESFEMLPEKRELPLSSVAHVNVWERGGSFGARTFHLNDQFSQWSNSERIRLELIQSGLLLNKWDWVKATLNNGHPIEFQFVGLEANRLKGGDTSIAIANISSMEIYPIAAIAPTKGEQAANTVGAVFGAVAAAGLLIIMTGGLAAPMIVVP